VRGSNQTRPATCGGAVLASVGVVGAVCYVVIACVKSGKVWGVW
jgi:hypothetical protein